MAVDKIRPNDPRVRKSYTEVGGRKWHYWDAAAKGQQKAVVFLIHGYPDISFGWRYQIPMLTEMGLRCIALDCMGYSDTGTSSELHDFGFKHHADAIAGICKQQGIDRIIIGGHDWGGAVIFRVAQWYPDLVSHIFSVCTPYFKVFDQYVSTETLVNTSLPQFGYQLQFGSLDHKLEKVINDETKIRKWLTGMYGGKPKSGKTFMSPENGIDLDMIENDEFGMTPLLNQEELDFYVKEFAKNGVNGANNWYRTREVNHNDEKDMPQERRNLIEQPALFIQALKENILLPEMSKGMEKVIPNLTRGEVPASHWALWHTPEETNAIIHNWFQQVVFGGKSKL